ncbi:hypothetical protein HBN50_11655 [Halobacteriovorax sp. GB3]|uniref:endonuclease/exonuclease/phosphatase family protein n=1 Tax=Halobacteriovorax sp. GB3 TaxID=2719615 RepID=UPI002360B68B|nr:hypothetical protein [Halobacteriovorax sp. GB3]MDD0853756.1 hypothetical protein [Halobacteriovorax sp. GB3]
MKKFAPLCFIFLLFSCSHARTLEVMSYNVENLFDTKHDEGKLDWAYLPKDTEGKTKECKKVKSRRRRNECLDGDWTKEKFDIKIGQITDAIVKERGKTPDLLALVEVENENAVKALADSLKYKSFVVSNGPDNRGIDLALLYKEEKGFKLISKKEIKIETEEFKKWPTRNILEVEFLYKKKYPLTVFVNHWPSLANPTINRIRVATALKKRIDELLKKNKNHYIMALGDFNTNDKDHPHPFKDVLLKDETMFDLHESYRSDRSISWDEKNSMPPGTHFFAPEMSWNILDRIFLSKNFKDKKGMSVKNDSYSIYAPNFLTDTYEYRSRKKYLNGSKVRGVPRRYNHSAKNTGDAGYSDHFPVLFKVNVK